MDRRKNRRKTNSYKGVNTIILEFFVSKLSKKIIKNAWQTEKVWYNNICYKKKANFSPYPKEKGYTKIN